MHDCHKRGDDVVVVCEDPSRNIDGLLLEMIFGLVVQIDRLEASCYLP